MPAGSDEDAEHPECAVDDVLPPLELLGTEPELPVPPDPTPVPPKGKPPLFEPTVVPQVHTVQLALVDSLTWYWLESGD